MINQSSSHDLFFGPSTVKDFPSVLNEVQENDMRRFYLIF